MRCELAFEKKSLRRIGVTTSKTVEDQFAHRWVA